MIYFSDPSLLNVVNITEYLLICETNNNQVAQYDGVAIIALWGDTKVSTPRIVWGKWDSYSMPVIKEHKKSSFYIVKHYHPTKVGIIKFSSL